MESSTYSPHWTKLATVSSRALGLPGGPRSRGQSALTRPKAKFTINAEVDQERGYTVIQTYDRRQSPFRFTIMVQDADSSLVAYAVGSTFAQAELMAHKTFLAKGLGPYKDWSQSNDSRYQGEHQDAVA